MKRVNTVHLNGINLEEADTNLIFLPQDHRFTTANSGQTEEIFPIIPKRVVEAGLVRFTLRVDRCSIQIVWYILQGRDHLELRA